MKRTLSLILIITYISSLFCFIAPWVHFSINQDYIKTHLCESLTNPDIKDCDGFCYLKKQVKEHHQDHNTEHSDATVLRDIPVFLFYAQAQCDYLIEDLFSRKVLVFDEFLAQQVYAEPLSPPPQS